MKNEIKEYQILKFETDFHDLGTFGEYYGIIVTFPNGEKFTLRMEEHQFQQLEASLKRTINTMTKKEAIVAMEEGKRVTHRWFTKDEYIKMTDGRLIDECGNVLDRKYFWQDRKGGEWETDWSIFKN